MDSDNCSVSQDFIIPNYQTPTPQNNSSDKETENISSPEKVNDMSASITTVYGAQQQPEYCIPTTEPDSCLSTASQYLDENHLSEQRTHVVAGEVISDEKQSLAQNHETINSHIVVSAEICDMSQPEAMDLSQSNDSASLECQGVSSVLNEVLVSLPEKEQNDSGVVIGQNFDQALEVEIAADERYSADVTSETKQSSDGSVLIGPVVPSLIGKETQECHRDISYSNQEKPPTDSSYVHRENISSTASDLRYNLSVESVPRLVATASTDFQGFSENFLRGCKWSPDGSCVLTNSNDNCLRTFQPLDGAPTSTELSDHKQIAARLRMKECGLIYDYTWHPQMSLAEGDFGRIACTCSGIPIHLWDAGKGQIVANFRAYDQFDEITPAYSLAFSLDGSKLYAGYNKTIRLFDTEYPGRSCKVVKTYDSQKKDGQTGIVSCFTFSPDRSGLYVAGSYSRHIGMYDSACDKLVCLMQGQHGGVTHLMFSPDATKLYSGGRKDAEILCWDMRNMDKILFSALRDVKTNQRMYFDLSKSGRYLVSGNTDGTVAFWDTLSPIEEINGDSFLKPCSQFQAHADCVNGVSFNHQHNLLATASGQRHFHNFDTGGSDSSGDENMEEPEPWDFSMRLWQIPMCA